MLQEKWPVINECVLAFDLHKQRYITIGAGIAMLAGFGQNKQPVGVDFWNNIIHPDDRLKVNAAWQRVITGTKTEINYRLIPIDGSKIRHITEVRSVYTDTITGNQVLLSVLNETASPGEDEAEANKREQFLLSVLNSQTNFVIRLDRSGCYTFVNETFCRAMGYNAGELLGQYFSINTAAEDMASCEAAFITCLNNPGMIIPLVKDKVTKSIQHIPSEWEFVSVVNELGEVSEIQGIGRDITDRFESEKQIKQAAGQLDNFLESITDSFFILDKQWCFIKTNSAFQNIAHKTSEQLIGNNFWEMFPTLKGLLTEEMLRRAMETQETLKFTEHFTRPNLWFRVAAYPSAEGLTVFVKNITRQKQTEIELNQVRNNLETLINNTDDLIWSIDLDKKYIYTNAAYTNAVFEETGIVPTVGEDAVVYGPANTIDIWNEYYERALGGERYSLIYENAHSRQGENLHYEVNFNPITNPAGQVVGTGCFARDITSLLRSEKEIIVQNERLRQIASLSSHELRRPVASMLGLINIIDFENFGNPDNKETISYLLTVGKEIDEVIRLIVDNTFTD